MEEKILRHFDLSSQYGVREVPCSSFSPEHMLTLSSRVSASPGSSAGGVRIC